MNTHEIYDYIERISELFRIDSRQAGAAYGLLPVQLEVMHYLSICNKYSDTPMAVTEYLGQTKGTVSQTINVLENKKLLTKQLDKKDKRKTHLLLTTKGKRLLVKLIPTPMLDSACSQLSNITKSEITSALDQLLMALLKDNSMRSFGACESCRHNTKISNNEFFCDLVKQPLTVEETKLICKEHEVK